MDAKSLVVALAVGVAAVSVCAAPAPPTRKEADSLQQKVATINALAGKSVKTSKVRHRTVITENEVNAYFVYDSKNDLPPGVVNPSIAIVGPGRVSGRAVVDLDAVRKASPPRSLLDPKNLLMGRVPLSAAGVLTTSNGVGRFALESANVGNVPLPKLLLDEIVGFYTRTSDKPNGISIDDPFPLPSDIREIEVTPGQAVIVQ